MNNVVVRLGDLREAASKLGPLRVPRGFRGAVSRATPDANGISVETPYLEISVAAKGRWESVVAVYCKLLHDTLQNLKRLWGNVGGDDAMITLSADGRQLEFYWSNGESTRRHAIAVLGV